MFDNGNVHWCMLGRAFLCRTGYFCVEPGFFVSNHVFCCRTGLFLCRTSVIMQYTAPLSSDGPGLSIDSHRIYYAAVHGVAQLVVTAGSLCGGSFCVPLKPSRKNPLLHVYVYWIIKYDTLVRLHREAPLKWTQWLLVLKHTQWNVTTDFVNHFALILKCRSD